MDCFVVAHFFGWFFKALLILRDVWITTVISFTFELLEYTFEHQLPNFSECWWDHVCVNFIHVLFHVSEKISIVPTQH